MVNKPESKGKRRLLMGGLLLAIMIAIGCMLYAQAEKEQAEQRASGHAPEPTQALSLHAYAGDQITPTPKQTMPGISIPGWTGIKLKAGETVVNVPFYNPEENGDWFYLTFQLKLKETDEVLFTTGLIPPGQYCNMVSLNTALEPGTYEGILFVQPYMMDNLATTNNLEMPLEIVVYE